jgi:hypothetical protein
MITSTIPNETTRPLHENIEFAKAKPIPAKSEGKDSIPPDDTQRDYVKAHRTSQAGVSVAFNSIEAHARAIRREMNQFLQREG